MTPVLQLVRPALRLVRQIDDEETTAPVVELHAVEVVRERPRAEDDDDEDEPPAA